jgi:transposase
MLTDRACTDSVDLPTPFRNDLAAVRNAITERWSNGQTEGQINRLKTLKRQMYGRAGTELLRARLLPFVHGQ